MHHYTVYLEYKLGFSKKAMFGPNSLEKVKQITIQKFSEN